MKNRQIRFPKFSSLKTQSLLLVQTSSNFQETADDDNYGNTCDEDDEEDEDEQDEQDQDDDLIEIDM